MRNLIKICIGFSLLYYNAIIVVAETERACKIERSRITNKTATVVWNPDNFISQEFPNEIRAKPLCLDSRKFTINRECKLKNWLPVEAPTCQFAQDAFEDSNSCPLGYTSITSRDSKLCVLITEPKKWENSCLFVGSSAIFYDLKSEDQKAVLDFLKKKNIKEVWMPAKRSSTFASLGWTIAGESYGETVDFDNHKINLLDDDNIIRDGCFSATVDSSLNHGYIKNCDNSLPILCIYKDFGENMLQLACPDEFYTTPYQGHQQHCYAVHRILEGNATTTPNINVDITRRLNWIQSECNGDLFIMNSIEKTVIFKDISNTYPLDKNDHCLFSVHERNQFVNDQLSWYNHLADVKYVNWEYPINDGAYLTANMHGKWNWARSTFNCIACEKEIDIYKPELVLNFNEGNGHLYLIVYGEEFLWRKSSDAEGVKCFTNSDYELITTVKIQDRIFFELNTNALGSEETRKTISKTVYKLKLYGDGPGYYWCQAHAIPNFEIIEAPKVVAYRRSNGKVFATLVDTKCSKCEKLFLKKEIKKLAKDFEMFLQEFYETIKDKFDFEINIKNVRVMQIEEIYSRKKAKILYHLTVSTKHTFSDNASDNAIKLPVDQYKIYKIKELLEKVLGSAKSDIYTFLSLNSTEYCVPETLSSQNKLTWVSAKIGETTAPIELCLLSSGLPILRKCAGDFIYGGIWLNLTRQECHNNVSNITNSLYNFDRTFLQSNETRKVVQNITNLFVNSSSEQIVPADLFYLGRLMHTVSSFRSNDTTLLNKSDTENIFSIYNSLMYLNESTTRISAALNSTNILLDAFDNIINGIAMDNITSAKYRNNIIVNLDDGTIASQTERIIVYVIDPFIKNVSGIALIKKEGLRAEKNDFTDYTVKLLYSNQSSSELLKEDGLEIAAFAPTNLLNSLNKTNDTTDSVDEIRPPIQIVITIYYNDRLFQEYKKITYAKTVGKIISVSIPGYDHDLPDLFPIYFNSDNLTDETNKISPCGYWSFANDSGWASDGCEYIVNTNEMNSITLCACSHLTSFSYLLFGQNLQLIDVENDVESAYINMAHRKALDIITLVGCTLSLLGIFGIFLTALVFYSWREKPSSIVLLQLSAAIALKMILFCFINTDYNAAALLKDNKKIICIGLGALLHYSVLVEFSWMLIIAYLQFMRYVKVLGKTRATRFFLKSFLIGWIAPLIPVVLVITIASNSYTQIVEIENDGICYPSGSALNYGVVLPISLILFANLIIFLLVIYNILLKSTEKIRTNERDTAIHQLRVSVFLFFLLGFTWIFGLLSTTKTGEIFSYLFCITATVQGFLLFVYFIILDPNTRKLWRNFFENYFSCCFANKFHK